MARILIVDDEPSILAILSALFRTEGYEVVVSQDGNQAVDLIRSDEHFDAIISDFRMSPVNGLWLLSLVRELRPDVPVIMVTAYYTKERARQAIEMGAAEYVSKPFDSEKLLATVRRLIDEKKN